MWVMKARRPYNHAEVAAESSGRMSVRGGSELGLLEAARELVQTYINVQTTQKRWAIDNIGEALGEG